MYAKEQAGQTESPHTALFAAGCVLPSIGYIVCSLSLPGENAIRSLSHGSDRWDGTTLNLLIQGVPGEMVLT